MKRTITCLRCRHQRRHEGRGLCKTCIRQLRAADQLHLWPKLGQPKKVVVEDDPVAYTGGWIRRGGILLPAAPKPVDEPIKPTCMDCNGPTSRPTVNRCKDCRIAWQKRNQPQCACGKRLGDKRAKVCRDCYIRRTHDWDYTAARFAHKRFNLGHRGAWTKEGEREYNRLQKASQRARKEAA